MECLRKILAMWLGHDKPPDCDSTTVHVLAIALRHPSVNEGQVANRIERWPAGTVYVLFPVTLRHNADPIYFQSRFEFTCLSGQDAISYYPSP